MGRQIITYNLVGIFYRFVALERREHLWGVYREVKYYTKKDIFPSVM